MALADIRTAVKALLETASGVGVVNDIDPFGNDPEHFADHFVEPTSGRINGWSIGIREMDPDQFLGAMDRRYEVRLRGLMGVEDEERRRADSEASIQAVLNVFALVGANRRLPSSGTPSADWTQDFRTAMRERLVRSGEGQALCDEITVTFTAVKQEALT